MDGNSGSGFPRKEDERAALGKLRLVAALGKVVHRHHDVPIFEGNVGGGGELIGCSPGANFFDCEMNRARPDLEKKSQSHFTKPGVDFLDPVLEAFRVEGAHVARQDRVHQAADGFALLLRPGMHQDH